MDTPAARIHESLKNVAQLRAARGAQPALVEASGEIKRFQARRFEATYADVLADARYAGAATFFLNELYGDKDYADRDQQFAKIANTMATVFPQSVVGTAAALAELHALTEELDHGMAEQWLGQKMPSTTSDMANACSRYVGSWRKVADADTRTRQLHTVLRLGHKLNGLTRKAGLRALLKMMRRPAAAAGLSSLQNFLESGFDAFAGMRGADDFLSLVDRRETALIQSLFHEDRVACETKLCRLMATGAA